MVPKQPAKPRKILYNVVGTCRLCKIRFLVDRGKDRGRGHFAGNYCVNCAKKFNTGWK